MMHINEQAALNHGIRQTALFFEKFAHLVKPSERPYYLALCNLVAGDPIMFLRQAYGDSDIRFKDFVSTGKGKNARIKSCTAYYVDPPIDTDGKIGGAR